MKIDHPYLLFLGDAPDDLAAKTARGIADWRPDWCLGQIRLAGCETTLGLPDMTPAEAAAAGARTMVVGVANRGGVISDGWRATLVEALDAGMDLASGLHQPLTSVPGLADKAAAAGRRLIDARHPGGDGYAVATGAPRPGRRLLTVGTDCSVGKMYTSLAIEREMKARGMAVDFRATGQTGILIAGAGVPVDAVVADFISGATESLSPANDADHWDVIEGQGSLFHPSYAGVTLGLIHGAQAGVLVLCHEPTRTHMRGLPGRALPPLKACIEANLRAARVVDPDVRCIGIAVNTHALDDDAAARLLDEIEDRMGLPTVDAIRTGTAKLVDNLD